MCGIFGIAFKDSQRHVSKAWLQGVTASMTHRGPNGEGVFVENNIGFGHRRLSIIDLDSGQQPMFNESNDIVIVFNGEIYNFPELKTRLEKLGHTFKTHCDTEVIVHGYEEWGCNSVHELRGMFAFAIYNRRKKEIFIARDRVGIKPLYFYQDDTSFMFASEIKALLAAGLAKTGVNKAAIDFYINLGYVPAPETLFSNIYKVCPGEALLLKSDFSVKKETYWDLKFSDDKINGCSQPYESELKELFTDCVRSHLISDVPLGVFLSGGLDSSSVVAVMAKVLNVPVKTFSVGYEGNEDISELGYARRVAEYFGTEHHEFILHAAPFFDALDTFLEFTEEPIVESAAIALYELSKLAKSQATVLLSGEGADELFAGYPIYGKMQRIEKLHSLLSSVNCTGLIPSNCKPLPEKIRKYLQWLKEPFTKRYRTVSSDVIGSVCEEMYTNEFAGRIADEFDALFSTAYERMNGGTMLQKMLYVDTKFWLADDLLLKADKSTMAASIELRVPFLDHVLIEHAAGLPDECKNNGREGKIILKKMMEGLLPSDIIYRKKRGFPVPIAQWFANELYGKIRDIMLDERTLARGYFNRAYIDGILRRHKAGHFDYSRRILSLLTLELWHRKYIDGGIS
ncbi:MAG: asparagine synthase (glutamine-hydrolyzing) [Nitrospirae bacterium]|nr:asparagine synthase (glutamine-hydrolyzing) [Nitrospirota bacterium]